MSTGGFYSHELGSGLAIWMADALGHGIGLLLSVWSQNLWALVKLASLQAVPIAAVVVFTLMMAVVQRGIVGAVLGPMLPIAMIGILVSAVIAVFYSSVGLITARLAFAMIPPLIVVAGAIAVAVVQRLEATQRRVLSYGCLMITTAQLIFVIVKDGPYS
jgi:hypothetical protein